MSARHPERSAGQRRTLLAACLAVALIAGVGMYLSLKPAAVPVRASVLPETLALPEFTLTTQSGQRFTRESFAGHWSWLFFGFTHCPDICPATLQQLALARRQLADDGSPGLPEIVFVSVDPERDTAETIGAYAAAFGDSVTGVTGSLDEIDRLTRPLGIYHARVPQDDGTYQVEHTSAVLLINERGELAALFSAPHEVAALAADTALIMGAR